MPVVTTVPERTNIVNIDIYSMLRRLDRMRTEVGHCQSADMPNGLLPFDATRIQDYIEDYRSFFAFIESKPLPDAPETHGNFSLVLPDDSSIVQPEQVENEDCRSLLLLMMQLRTELQNSQSARLPQGIIPTPEGQPGDRARIKDFIARIEALVGYATSANPSDRPESTPLAMPTPAGRLGT